MDEALTEVLELIDTALKEDIREGDITSEACIAKDREIEGNFVLKQDARIAGLNLLEAIFKRLSPEIEIHYLVEEGQDVSAGSIIATIKGPAREILAGERVALNILQHASGVATSTSRYVTLVKSFSCDILDTRKTLPGMRALEKYAVRVGGGTNHRYSLNDRFLIKDNHLSFLEQDRCDPIVEAVNRARSYRPGVKVEVEVADLAMVDKALEANADIIMLDNMTVEMTREAVTKIAGKAYVEASGGISFDSVRDYAATGVNGISIGKLTHSVEAIDISLSF